MGGIVGVQAIKKAKDDFDCALNWNIEKQGSSADVYDAHGQCDLLMKDYESAWSYFTDAIKQDSKNDIHRQNSNYFRNRAKCHIEQKKYQEGITDLLEADKISTGDPQILYELGITFFFDTRYRKCLKFLKLALKTEHAPNVAYVDDVNSKELREKLNMSSGPHLSYLADVYYHIGLSYARLEKFEKSIFPLSKCIEYNPNDIRYIHERAKAN